MSSPAEWRGQRKVRKVEDRTIEKTQSDPEINKSDLFLRKK